MITTVTDTCLNAPSDRVASAVVESPGEAPEVVDESVAIPSSSEATGESTREKPIAEGAFKGSECCPLVVLQFFLTVEAHGISQHSAEILTKSADYSSSSSKRPLEYERSHSSEDDDNPGPGRRTPEGGHEKSPVVCRRTYSWN